jgi:hypothetical protein
MLNNTDCNIIVNECIRLRCDLTHRGFRRFMSRFFGDSQDFEIVFDLKAGESPKKSMFERMATHAEAQMASVLELAHSFTVIEKIRSPKYGKITYKMQSSVSSTATLNELRSVLRELCDLVEACADVDTHGSNLFQA